MWNKIREIDQDDNHQFLNVRMLIIRNLSTTSEIAQVALEALSNYYIMVFFIGQKFDTRD